MSEYDRFAMAVSFIIISASQFILAAVIMFKLENITESLEKITKAMLEEEEE